DLAFVVYEKFNQLLIRNPGILARLALIIIDEVQLLLDPSRGPVLERALAKVRLRGVHIQIVALSSALNQSRDVADWLRCTLLHKTHRPVELFQGVLWKGTFRFRKYNAHTEGAEDFPWLEHSNPQEVLFMNLRNLLEQGDQILVFLKSKKQVEVAALLLADQLKSRPADLTRRELLELEPTYAQRTLLATLQSGIAFHNADMTFEERKLIEKQYLAGEIRIVFCTSTLSLGVNLPAKTVFIEPVKFQTFDDNNSSVLLPLDWWEYENMAGRAGRLGQQEFGRAICIANTEFEAESLWESYIETKSKVNHRNLMPADLEASILDLISAFGPIGLDGMREFLSKGLFSGKEPSIDAIHGATTGLLDKSMLVLNSHSKLKATALGQIAAQENLSSETLNYIRGIASGHFPSPSFYLIFLLMECKEIKPACPWVTYNESRSRVYQIQLEGLLSSAEVIAPELNKLVENPGLMSKPEQRKLKGMFLLLDWIEGQPTFDLENKYMMRAGQIHQLAEQMSWLFGALSQVVQVYRNDAHGSLRLLAARIRYGVTDDGVFLAELRIPGLGRTFIQRLISAGITDCESVRNAGIERLNQLLPHRLAARLFNSVNSDHIPAGIKPVVARKHQEMAVHLYVDGTPVKNRFCITLNQKPVSLPAKSFDYLLKLASSRHNSEDGWVHKEDLEPGFNQARYLHRLKRQLLPYLPSGFDLIENNRLGSYRLNLKKENIALNLDNIPTATNLQIADPRKH
ncbi:MAG: hypothetical protein L0Y74_05370, partial [candidate division Zixibacteria bacterium]|nr:hypothetical protein [candidate division Zixibacteria bacterium]